MLTFSSVCTCVINLARMTKQRSGPSSTHECARVGLVEGMVCSIDLTGLGADWILGEG